jgi:hypothetical protein
MALVRPVLHRLSCSNETVQDAPKHEFWVQWSGTGAFAAKKGNATSFSEMPKNMSFGSNGVDRVRSLRKIKTKVCLANLGINGASSCCTETVRDAPKHEFWGQWSGTGAFVAKNSNATLFSELVR